VVVVLGEEREVDVLEVVVERASLARPADRGRDDLVDPSASGDDTDPLVHREDGAALVRRDGVVVVHPDDQHVTELAGAAEELDVTPVEEIGDDVGVHADHGGSVYPPAT